MIDIVKEHIVYRFGIPQTVTTDQGTMFASGEFDEFAIGMGIKVLNSSPYYAQANGQAEASNNRIIKVIKRKFEENPKRSHTLLNEALWSYRMALLGILNVTTKSRLSFLILITAPKMPNLYLMPLKPSCHP